MVTGHVQKKVRLDLKYQYAVTTPPPDIGEKVSDYQKKKKGRAQDGGGRPTCHGIAAVSSARMWCGVEQPQRPEEKPKQNDTEKNDPYQLPKGGENMSPNATKQFQSSLE